jgi:hypothetical protein
MMLKIWIITIWKQARFEPARPTLWARHCQWTKLCFFLDTVVERVWRTIVYGFYDLSHGQSPFSVHVHTHSPEYLLMYEHYVYGESYIITRNAIFTIRARGARSQGPWPTEASKYMIYIYMF